MESPGEGRKIDFIFAGLLLSMVRWRGVERSGEVWRRRNFSVDKQHYQRKEGCVGGTIFRYQLTGRGVV